MSLVITPAQVTAGTKQFGYNPPRWFGYQTKGSLIPYRYYWDDSITTPITVVGTATKTKQTSSQPVVGDLFGTIFSPLNTEVDRPLVDSQRAYTQFNIAAINSGGKITLGATDLSKMNWVVLVDKASVVSKAGKMKVRSGVGAESVCAFTTSATANQWIGGARNTGAHIFQFKVNGATGVSHTGTPDFAAITEIEVTSDLGTDTLSVYETYFFEDYRQAIGYVNSITLKCLAGFSEEANLEQSTLLCNQLAEMNISTGRTLEYTFTVKKQALTDLALVNGDIARMKDVVVTTEYVSPNVNPLTIASGTITLPSANVVISNLTIGDREFARYHSATGVPLDFFHQNGATITFNTEYNGKKPTVIVFESKSLATMSIKFLEQGPVGYMVLPRRTESGRVMYDIAYKVQLSQSGRSGADDGDEVEIKATFMANNDGLFLDKSLE